MTQAVVSNFEIRRVDRRSQPTPILSKYTFTGGRRAGERRRHLSSEGHYIDRYNSTDLAIILSVALFNILDCFFTLVQLGRGATELNPFVNYLIDFGPGMFIFVKCLGVGLILAFLCMHRNFKLARRTLAFAWLMYFSLFVYHLVLYFFW